MDPHPLVLGVAVLDTLLYASGVDRGGHRSWRFSRKVRAVHASLLRRFVRFSGSFADWSAPRGQHDLTPVGDPPGSDRHREIPLKVRHGPLACPSAPVP